MAFYQYNPAMDSGIHSTGSKPTRVMIDNSWTIELPPGLSYTSDKKCIGKSPSDPHKPRLFQAQNSENLDFDNPHGGKFSFTLQPNKLPLDIYCESLLEKDVQEALQRYVDLLQMLGDLKPAKYTEEIAVYYCSHVDEDGCGLAHYLVFCPRVRTLYMGEIMEDDGTSDRAFQALIAKMLQSVEAVTAGNAVLDPSFLPVYDQEQFSFSEKTAVDVGDGITVFVPDGFLYSTDANQIGDAFQLIMTAPPAKPDENAKDAPIGILFQRQTLPVPLSYTAENFSVLLNAFFEANQVF